VSRGLQQKYSSLAWIGGSFEIDKWSVQLRSESMDGWNNNCQCIADEFLSLTTQKCTPTPPIQRSGQLLYRGPEHLERPPPPQRHELLDRRAERGLQKTRQSQEHLRRPAGQRRRRQRLLTTTVGLFYC